MSVVAGWRQHPILWTTSAVLLLVSAAEASRGLSYLLSQKEPATDLHMRWQEQRYVYHGQNPYDVVQLVRAEKFHLPLPECTRDNRVDPEIGAPYHRAGGYPPWAFLTAAPLVLPTRWLFASIYFAILDVLALTITFAWAYQIGRPQGRAAGVFLGAAALAIFGHYRALQVGQYGILVNAMLIGVFWLGQKRQPLVAGILFGMALLKPQISALFALGFLVRKQWKLLAAATFYVVLACLVTWSLTKTNPIEMLGQMYALAQTWVDHPDPAIQQEQGLGHSSFSQLLLDLHVDRKIATPLAATVGLLLSGVLTWLWRNGSTLTLFAIAATTGRLWSYHHPYDDVMLIFLLIALGRQVLSQRSPALLLAFGVVGLSLWTPTPLYRGYPLAVHIAQIVSWLVGLAALVVWEPRE